MDKGKVIKALELCGRVDGCDNCMDCPYKEMPFCDSAMCNDAIALLEASETAKATRYSIAYIYTKKANLLPYLTGKVVHNYNAGYPMTTEQAKRVRDSYAKEIDVELIAMFRWEKGKCFCRIKCPINPLPVKGEFEAPSMSVIADFLKKEGWSFKQKVYPKMFE